MAASSGKIADLKGKARATSRDEQSSIDSPSIATRIRSSASALAHDVLQPPSGRYLNDEISSLMESNTAKGGSLPSNASTSEPLHRSSYSPRHDKNAPTSSAAQTNSASSIRDKNLFRTQPTSQISKDIDTQWQGFSIFDPATDALSSPPSSSLSDPRSDRSFVNLDPTTTQHNPPLSNEWITTYKHQNHHQYPHDHPSVSSSDGAAVVHLLSDPTILTPPESPSRSASPPSDLFTHDIPPAALALLQAFQRQHLPSPPASAQLTPRSTNETNARVSMVPIDARPLNDHDTSSSLSLHDPQTRQDVLPELDLNQWHSILDTYTDKVWGHVAPLELVHQAREEVLQARKEDQARDGNDDEDGLLAVRRLGLLMGHLVRAKL
ncbi:MAG: hypothetical protein M1825_002286 [Sarcosagium campestre]|nr:MAG: hypothetical protein M1825_002286 [Sarcosagium campestre]